MKNKNLLLIGGAIALYFILRKRASIKGIAENLTTSQKNEINRFVDNEVNQLNITPFANNDEFYKHQYEIDLRRGKI